MQQTSINGSKALIVYYSASGSTKRVAENIASELQADTFELKPISEYMDEDLDWTNSNSRVNKEHDDESLRDVALESTTVSNWEDYDTIFIGYPIWWGIAAWPVNNFIKANNFAGKTVIPFCTSASSGLGESAELLKEMSNDGDWLEGKRFSSSVNSTEVSSWLNSINK